MRKRSIDAVLTGAASVISASPTEQTHIEWRRGILWRWDIATAGLAARVLILASLQLMISFEE
jgi:hypothetical protein